MSVIPSELFKEIAAEIREHNAPPVPSMLLRDYYVAKSVFEFANALERLGNRDSGSTGQESSIAQSPTEVPKEASK